MGFYVTVQMGTSNYANYSDFLLCTIEVLESYSNDYTNYKCLLQPNNNNDTN